MTTDIVQSYPSYCTAMPNSTHVSCRFPCNCMEKASKRIALHLAGTLSNQPGAAPCHMAPDNNMIMALMTSCSTAELLARALITAQLSMIITIVMRGIRGCFKWRHSESLSVDLLKKNTPDSKVNPQHAGSCARRVQVQ